MKASELAMICSSSPGFLRSAGTALGKHFRLIESYTIQEAVRMLQLHQPSVALIDLRGGSARQVERTWATIASTHGTRFVVVVLPDQMDDGGVSQEIQQKTEIVELTVTDKEMAGLVQQILTGKQLNAVLPASSDIDGSASEVSSRCESQAGVPAPRDLPCTESSDNTPRLDERTGGISIADRYRTRTPELRQMLRRLEVAARHNVTLLMIGETGSGKTHLAKLIHDFSPRAKEPFLHVACGALPGELIESELFGHVRGAFTSAHADKDGKFLVAGNGTILLDEIDVLAPDQQVKLLRVIEEGEFEPVGSNRTLHVRARVIAASNLQLQPLVEQGRFRPDLYYRLNTLCFNIPPLRKRLPDVEPLARYFVHCHAEQMGIEVVEISQEFIDCLLKYPWPGNVREMENAIRSAVIYSDHGRMVPDTLPQHIVDCAVGPSNDPSVSAFFAVRRKDTLEKRIGLTEKDLIQQALLNNNFSRTNTARHLGISRVTLYNKMRKYGIMLER